MNTLQKFVLSLALAISLVAAWAGNVPNILDQPPSGSLTGGTTGQVPYQSAPSTTAFTGPGTAGQVLTSNGAAAPTYQAPGAAGALSGGLAEQVPYQSAPGVTAFSSQPTKHNYYFSLSGNSTGTGINNASFGQSSMTLLSTGSNDSAFGFSALQSLNTGVADSAFGSLALESTTSGTYNSAFGQGALQKVTTANDNTAVGYAALNSNVGGLDNSALGWEALLNNVSGNYNVAIGSQAGGFVTSTGNTLVGYAAGSAITSGAQNTTYGYNSGGSLTTGADNTIVGYNTGTGIVTGSNNTIIGANVNGLSSTLANNVIIADGAGNVRMQFDSSGNSTYGGNVSTSGQLVSTVTTGTAPIVVSSTTTVANLNIGGNAANVTGTVAAANGGTGAASLGLAVDAATVKTTPVGADEILLSDSAASFATKKTTITDLAAVVGGGSTPTTGFLAGFAITYSSTTAITVASGNCLINGTLESFTGATLTSGSTMKDLNNAVVNLGASKAYYVYAWNNGGTLQFAVQDWSDATYGGTAVYDLTNDYYKAAYAPVGANARRIGKFVTDGSGNIISFVQTSEGRTRNFSFTATNVLFAGSSATYTQIVLTPFALPDDAKISGYAESGGANSILYVSIDGANNTFVFNNNAASGASYSNFVINTNVLYYKTVNSGYMYLNGFSDYI
jgi:hypothetical protein